MSRADGIPVGTPSLGGPEARSVVSAAEFLASAEPSGASGSRDESEEGAPVPGSLARGRDVVVIGSGQLAFECVGTAMAQGASTVLVVPATAGDAGVGSYATGELDRDPETGAVTGVHVRRSAAADPAADQPDAAQDETIPASLVVIASGFAGGARSAYDAHARESAAEGLALPFDSSGSVLVMEGAVFEDADATDE